MRPPNLISVHAIQQGKQVAGEKESTNLFGNEGITLEDDLAVAIHTEWLDSDGRPFPAEMGADYEKIGVIPHASPKSPKIPTRFASKILLAVLTTTLII